MPNVGKRFANYWCGDGETWNSATQIREGSPSKYKWWLRTTPICVISICVVSFTALQTHGWLQQLASNQSNRWQLGEYTFLSRPTSGCQTVADQSVRTSRLKWRTSWKHVVGDHVDVYGKSHSEFLGSATCFVAFLIKKLRLFCTFVILCFLVCYWGKNISYSKDQQLPDFCIAS